MIWCGLKNGHHKDFYLEEIVGVCVQNLITFLSAIVSVIGRGRRVDLYDHLMSTRIFTLIMNMMFLRALKIKRKAAMA